MQVFHFGDQENVFKKVVDAGAFFSRGTDGDSIAAPVFGDQAVIGQLLLDPVRVGVWVCRSC